MKLVVGHRLFSVNWILQLRGSKPVLFYGHYDVMPAEDLENWQTDPFELSLKADWLYGRGVGDNKGQLLAPWINRGAVKIKYLTETPSYYAEVTAIADIGLI